MRTDRIGGFVVGCRKRFEVAEGAESSRRPLGPTMREVEPWIIAIAVDVWGRVVCMCFGL